MGWGCAGVVWARGDQQHLVEVWPVCTPPLPRSLPGKNAQFPQNVQRRLQTQRRSEGSIFDRREVAGDFCCPRPPSTALQCPGAFALRTTTPTPSLGFLPCAAPAPNLDLGRGRSIDLPAPPVSPSLVSFSSSPDRRATHDVLVFPKPSRVTIASSNPPPPLALALDCPSYNFILPRPTVCVARPSTGPSRPPPGR
jgi:hypothetical protein